MLTCPRHRTNPNGPCSALQWAVVTRNEGLLSGLLSTADVNERLCGGRTVLVYAIFLDWYPAVEALVLHGANVRARDEHHSTPLHTALDREMDSSARLLMDHGASIHDTGIHGRTILWDVCQIDHAAACGGY